MAKLTNDEIIPAVLAKIEHCDEQAVFWKIETASMYRPAFEESAIVSRYRAAADRLRDFATVELLVEGLK